MNVFDDSPKEVIAGPMQVGDEMATKYRAISDGRRFWAYNSMEVFYDDERMYHALDTIYATRAMMEAAVQTLNEAVERVTGR